MKCDHEWKIVGFPLNINGTNYSYVKCEQCGAVKSNKPRQTDKPTS